MRGRTIERMITAWGVLSVKDGGRNWMIWSCFVVNAFSDIYRGPGILNQHRYHPILQRHVIPSRTRLISDICLLMQDNDTINSSKPCKHYLQKKTEENMLTVMEWLHQSPDCNHIELVWDKLDRRVKK